MQLDQITMDRDEARRAFLAYRRAVRERHNEEDAEIMRGYRALSRGQQLIKLPEAIRAGGATLVSRTASRYDSQLRRGVAVTESFAVPRVGVARADAEFCWTNGINAEGKCEMRSKRELSPRNRRDRITARGLVEDGRGDTGVVLPNVWLGTSIENRRFVGRADALRETPAAVRFISAEPLLGPLTYDATELRWSPVSDVRFSARAPRWRDGYEGPALDLTGIDWLIVGGESGPQHRPIAPQWVRDLRDDCQRTDVAFFFKQWGGRTPKAGGRVLDGRVFDAKPAAAAQPTARKPMGGKRQLLTA